MLEVIYVRFPNLLPNYLQWTQLCSFTLNNICSTVQRVCPEDCSRQYNLAEHLGQPAHSQVEQPESN